MRIVRNVAGVCSVFDEIRPPRPKLGILDLAVLRFELEVSINSNKLCVDPPCERVSGFSNCEMGTLTHCHHGRYPNHLADFAQGVDRRDIRSQVIRRASEKEGALDEHHPLVLYL